MQAVEHTAISAAEQKCHSLVTRVALTDCVEGTKLLAQRGFLFRAELSSNWTQGVVCEKEQYSAYSRPQYWQL